MVKNFNNGKIYKIEYIYSNDDEAKVFIATDDSTSRSI